jgi:hypothetical protein
VLFLAAHCYTLRVRLFPTQTWVDTNAKSSGARRTPRSGWRPAEWAKDADVSRATTYNLMEGKVRDAPPLPSVKVGRARVITIAPAEYFALCAKQAGA